MTQESETQSLGQKAYIVFYQSYYLDEILWQSIADASHCLRHLEWCDSVERQKFCKTLWKEYGQYITREGYRPVYDPAKDDWTDYGKSERRHYHWLLRSYCSRLAGDACYTIHLKKPESGKPVLPTSYTSCLFHSSSLEPYGVEPRKRKRRRRKPRNICGDCELKNFLQELHSYQHRDQIARIRAAKSTTSSHDQLMLAHRANSGYYGPISLQHENRNVCPFCRDNRGIY